MHDYLYRSVTPSIFAVLKNCDREVQMKNMLRKRAMRYKYPGLVGL
jgi:hypothetical protein